MEYLFISNYGVDDDKIVKFLGKDLDFIKKELEINAN